MSVESSMVGSSTFDPVKAFVEQKRAYALVRGTAQGGGGSGYYPLTSTLDCFVFSRDFFRATQKSTDGLLERGSQALASAFGAGPTNSYYNAVAAWKATWPSVLDAATKPHEPYWNNLMFWDTGSKYSIARSALSAVPGHWTMLKEAVGERVDELLSRVDWKSWLAWGLAGWFTFQYLTNKARHRGE